MDFGRFRVRWCTRSVYPVHPVGLTVEIDVSPAQAEDLAAVS
jgi:hypothetical protein